MAHAKQIISGGQVGLVQAKHGFMLYNEFDQYIGKSIKHYGEFSEGEVHVFYSLLAAGDFAVEVGANIGAHTLPIAKKVGKTGRVFAFEPQYAVYQILCGNLALNGLNHARAYLAACGAAPGEIIVPVLDSGRETNFGGLSLGGHQQGDRVSVVTIDGMDLPRCKLLKIDVEGMELQVLQGATQTIQRTRPFLYIENDREDKSKALIEFIFQLGYRCFWHLPNMFNPNNYFGNSQNLFGRIVSINMLCIPKEMTIGQIDLIEVSSASASWQEAMGVSSPKPTASPTAAHSQTTDSPESSSQKSMPSGIAGSIDAAMAALAKGDLALAERAFDAIGKADMQHFGALWTLAGAAVAREAFQLAAKAFEHAAALNPSEPAVHSNLGAAYGRLEQHAKAAECFRKALEVGPEFADAHFNYGNALREIGHIQSAIVACQRGLQLAPDSVTGHFLIANAYSDLGQNELAKNHYERALAIDPNYAAAHKNLGVLLLRCGQFARGWAEYEWRFQADKVPLPESRFKQPYWDGSPLQGRTLLICGEQGFGDQIQFARYAKCIQGNVVLQVSDRLVPLLKPHFEHVIGQSEPRPDFDVHAPMMSLPRILGTDASNIPVPEAYLSADPNRVAAWKQRLEAFTGVRVGVAWQGNRLHKRDRMRSIPLETLRPLSQIEGVHLVCLQIGDGREQLHQCDWRHRWVDFTDQMDIDAAFVDTAAIIQSLDFVLTIDSALAHLSGAMGRPTWLLARTVCDWRWMMEVRRVAWYPTIEILRQPKMDDWSSVIPEIVARLQHCVATA